MKDSPSTTLYTLGKGKLYIANYSDACPVESWTDLGNSPRFEVEVTEELLEHYSSMSGSRTLDKTVVLETGYAVAFDLDEFSKNNLKIYLKGQLVGGGNKLRANQVVNQEYILRFISDNPEGPNETWEFWRLRLSPGGAISLISDEWALLPFSGKGLSDTTCHSTSPYFDVTFCTTTTTTTTSSSTSSTSSTA